MSLEKIDQYIKELDAVKYYDIVKRQRDEAQERIVKLGHEVSRLEGRVKELEEFKATVEGKTLNEAMQVLLEKKEKVIKEQAKEQADEAFSSMKAKWEKSEKPTEVENEAVKLLKGVVRVLGGSGPQLFLDPLMRADIPRGVEEILAKEVERRIDAEFTKRVEEKSSQEVAVKFDQMKSTERHKWLNENVEPRVTELEERILTNALRLIEGPWDIACDKCNTEQSKNFAPQEITELLSTRYVEVECVNPDCKNWGRHKIRIQLKDIVASRLKFG